MSKREGYCPECKTRTKAVSRTGCSSLFCSKCSGYVKLTRKPKEEI